ncbi:efflux RND transporter permease subunit [Taibaiella lutea]|uniref:Efflux RND transporter permease subunit n=1 Tax=Taibaiella lutea TaxID=2608001 RepID=A0A5M6CMY0_9BACT|nr:efflux RND transporter permease subunit [Taibaiella lutea]KAA5536494.1 efflux RND transporter permease subunit [Taibaiella lutea]
MSLPSFALKRPVFAVVANVFILIFGFIAFKFLGIRDYPSIDPPIISVRTSYSGANPDVIESQITEPLEKSINGIAGISNITSSSSQGTSNITVEFDLGEDLEAAANDVRDKVSQAVRSLPQDIDAPPVVSKADANSQPIISMTVQSETKNALELSDYAENILQERLQTIPGVSSIQIWGQKRYAMRLWFDPMKMAAYNITFSDVQAALDKQNIELPAGKVYGYNTELTVRTLGRLKTEDDFESLIIKNVNGTDLHLKDIGSAVLGPENEETQLKESGVTMVALALVPQPGSNYVAIADEFYKRYEQIKKDVPSDIKLNIAQDNTVTIKKSISEVQETIFIAFALVVVVIFLFFRDVLISIRPLIDIPVSLIGAFFIMYLFGFTINILTLLAIVLATGLVVDDGIVVAENIYKKMEAGISKHRAAKEGSEEIYFAVIATSITLAVIFLPIVFLQGFTGRLFREFGIVVAGAVIISCFVSLTLTPVLNVYLSRKDTTKKSKFYIKTEPFFAGMENKYRSALEWVMDHKWLAITGTIFCFAAIFFIGSNLKSELAPMEDRSRFRLSMTAPEGTSYDAMDNYSNQIAQYIMDSVPERATVLTIVSPGNGGAGAVNSANGNIRLVDPDQRKRSQDEIVQQVNSAFRKFNFGRSVAIQEQTIAVQRGGGSKLPVSFVLENINFDKLSKALPSFLDEANNSKILADVDVDLKVNKPELRITIDRAKASQLGVSVADVSQTLQLALSNGRLGYFTMNGKQYQVIGQVNRSNRDEPQNLRNYYVRNSNGAMISLDNIITIQENISPSQIYHYNRYKSATISANTAQGHTLGEGIQEMQRIFDKLKKDKVIDESFTTALSGSSKDYAESASGTSFAFILALVLIYLVLAAQFESFVDPFIIMLTVPLAIAGAVISLALFGQTLNIFSQIGMIMLIGLVTKNGILIVEYANHIRDNGASRREAVVDAAKMRLRPILMTSLAMVGGALPLALSLGAASTSRIPLGIVIVGGVIFSLLLSLFIVPVMYTFLSRRKRKEVTAVEKLND